MSDNWKLLGHSELFEGDNDLWSLTFESQLDGTKVNMIMICNDGDELGHRIEASRPLSKEEIDMLARGELNAMTDPGDVIKKPDLPLQQYIDFTNG